MVYAGRFRHAVNQPAAALYLSLAILQVTVILEVCFHSFKEKHISCSVLISIKPLKMKMLSYICAHVVNILVELCGKFSFIPTCESCS